MKNKGNQKEILVRNDDEELMNASKEFLENLEEGFEKHQENYNVKLENDSKYQKNKDFYFVPEGLTKRSPLTILNAPWGSGKTFFIENFGKLFIDNKIKSKLFKKMIIIDAWKFSNSKDVPMEFVLELSKILLKINNQELKGEKKNIFLGKMFKALAPTSMSFQINLPFFSFGIDKDLPKIDPTTKKIIEMVQNNETPILIFIDNLERLGSLSWDLLKSVIKLQEFSNYLIVLPLNLNKIKNNKYKKNNGEYPIEKYIDIKMFNFKQDYFGYFMDKLKNKEEAQIFNSIFSEEIDGEKLSIREVDQSIMSNNVLKTSGTYQKIKIIFQKIWNAKETIEMFLREDLDTTWKFLHKQKTLIEEVYSKITEKHQEKYLNFNDEFEKFDNYIVSWKDKSEWWMYYYQINHDYNEDLSSMNELINKREEYLKEQIKNVEDKIQTIKTKINKEEQNILSQQDKIEEYKRNIESEEEKEVEVRDARVITDNNNNITQANKWISEENAKKTDSNQELQEQEEYLGEYKKIQSKVFKELPSLIIELNQNKEYFIDEFGEEKLEDIVAFIKKDLQCDQKFGTNATEFKEELMGKVIQIVEK